MGEEPDHAVEVVAYRDEWPEQFEAERVALAAAYADDRMRYVSEKEIWVEEAMTSLR